jgi:4-alpha-glucanotransferase
MTRKFISLATVVALVLLTVIAAVPVFAAPVTEDLFFLNEQKSMVVRVDYDVEVPKVEFIADDLGGLDTGVENLEKAGGYPGMRVVQYAFDSRGTGIYAPHLYPENSVCYSSIHDDPPLKHWLDNASDPDRRHAISSLNLNETEGYVWGMIRGGMASQSRLCIVQMQDYLQLGAEARMNHPGTQSEYNWAWRVRSNVFTKELAERIAKLTRDTGRNG